MDTCRTVNKNNTMARKNPPNSKLVSYTDENGGHCGQGQGRSHVTLTRSKMDIDHSTDFFQVPKPKRKRHSTGGSYTSMPAVQVQVQPPVSKESFRNMNTDDKLVTLFDMMASVTSLDSRVHKLERNVSSIHRDFNYMSNRVETLEYKSIDQEARARRNNVIFRGIDEILRQEDCIALVKGFLNQHLGIPDVYIQRAHRIGKPKRGESRPIIACFRDHQDVENIMTNAKKLRNTNFGINRDFPPEIVQARSRLWGRFKEARKEYPNDPVFIGFPAKLIVKGVVVQDEFPDWKDVLSSSRVSRAKPTTSRTDFQRELQINTSNSFEPLMETDDHDSDSDDSECTTYDVTDVATATDDLPPSPPSDSHHRDVAGADGIGTPTTESGHVTAESTRI